MNQSDGPDEAPQVVSEVPETLVPRESFEVTLARWCRRFLACNPFYLVSAALLLFGVYRVSMDPGFLAKETAQLAFNFTSLQLYELLLVGTAVLLASRRIWYDSTLLVGLENLLLLVPFILISQAALIDKQTIGWISLVAGVLVIARFGILKRFLGNLNLPNRVLFLGLVILLVNIVLLVVYRDLQESRSQEWGPAYAVNEWSWMLILPAVFALGNFLPNAKEVGALLPQHRWLPSGFFALWLAGTSVHLYCLGYVYDFVLRRELIVPSLWVLAWTASWRISDFIAVPKPTLRRALLILPLIAALGAVQNGNRVFLALGVLNAAIFATLWLLKVEPRFVRHLLLTAIVMVVAGLPLQVVQSVGVGPHFHRGNFLAAGVALYVVLCTVFSRNPRLGLVGALVSATGVTVLLGDQLMAAQWAVQAGMSFLLLHSLRWDDAQYAGAAKLRLAVAGLWVLHSILWTRFGGDWWMVCVPAAAVLAGGFLVRIFRGRWEYLILHGCAVLVVLSGPGNALVGVIRMAPSGLLGIAGSFLLFALGTAAALTKHRWQHKPAA